MPDDDQMITLWSRMAALYGHSRWQTQYGPAFVQAKTASGQGKTDEHGKPLLVLSTTVETWRRSLRGITGAEIGLGIAACIQRNEDWPPSAPQFRERCRPHREPYQRPEFQGNALPQLPADRETALAHIAALRGQIGGAQ